MDRKSVVEVFYFDAGGGHRSAMSALVNVLTEQYPAWLVKPVDLQKLLEPIDPVHRVTRKITPSLRKLLVPLAPSLTFKPVQSQTLYNMVLKRGATLGVNVVLPLLKEFIKMNAPQIEKILKYYWQQPDHDKPDLVVSVVPNFNGVLCRSLKKAYWDVPYVTILTDLADCPPHFWLEDQDQFIICGTQTAYKQAQETGFYDAEKIFKVSGMILKKSFYDPPGQDRLTHEQIGLSPHLPTAVIMFGGNGSLESVAIVDRLKKAKLNVQTIVLCGNNVALYDSLQGIEGCHAVGFVANVADYLRLADFFIGKPGPGSLSEALHMGCPVIVELNAATMLQERPNVRWVKENGVGIVVKNFSREIVGAVRHMLSDLEIYKRNIQTNIGENRAVFEIAGLLEELIAAGVKRPHDKSLAAPLKSIR